MIVFFSEEHIAEGVIVLAKEHRSVKIGDTWEVPQKRSLCSC